MKFNVEGAARGKPEIARLGGVLTALGQLCYLCSFVGTSGQQGIEQRRSSSYPFKC